MEYKRKFRECPAEVRKKISDKMKGKKKTSTHKQNISAGLKDYWKGVPSISGTNFTSTGRIV